MITRNNTILTKYNTKTRFYTFLWEMYIVSVLQAVCWLFTAHCSEPLWGVLASEIIDLPSQRLLRGGPMSHRAVRLQFWRSLIFYLQSDFRKKRWNVNWDHSVRCVKVSSQSRLFPGMRSGHKFWWKSWKKEKKKEFSIRSNNKVSGSTTQAQSLSSVIVTLILTLTVNIKCIK